VGVIRLVAPATAGSGEPPGVLRQLTYLRTALEAGAGTDAQALFPEGYFFLHELYGLTWVELGQRAVEPARALAEARWALSQLDTPSGRAPFSAGLTPSYGVFYRGWTNWLRGGVLSLQPAGAMPDDPLRELREFDPEELKRFEDDSAALGAAFDAASTPFLPAYPGQAWPVDSTVAIASLALHDRLRPARFGATIGRWLDAARQRLDPRTGLLPHRVAVDTGAPLETARGSSQSVIQRFLVDIDPGWAAEQYPRFRANFVTSPLGLGPAVREFPVGLDGPGDVDSGPLVLGVTLSATVVTLGAAQVNGDTALAAALANYGELAGLPVDTPWSKRYAFGVLPLGDAFLAWSKSARPWVNPTPTGTAPGVRWWWRLPLLGLLTAVAVGPWLAVAVRRRRR
jgi:hypothetical protein